MCKNLLNLDVLDPLENILGVFRNVSERFNKQSSRVKYSVDLTPFGNSSWFDIGTLDNTEERFL